MVGDGFVLVLYAYVDSILDTCQYPILNVYKIKVFTFNVSNVEPHNIGHYREVK